MLLTNGSLQGFVLLASHLLADGRRRVVVEAPTYDRPLAALARLGADIASVPLDRDGLDLDALESQLLTSARPAFLYTIPTFQNPSGRTLPLERRRRLVDLARRHELLVVEDDPYGLVRFEGRPLPSLFELAGGEGIVYASSFSKTLAPGLRVGYLVLPAALVAPLETLAASTYVSPATLSQAIVFELVRRGGLEASLDRITELLRVRRDAMLTALAAEFPADATWTRPEGGYFVWVDLPTGCEGAELLERASAAGVTFVSGRDFYPESSPGGEHAARLAYSFVSPAEIAEGIRRLGRLLGVPLRWPARHAAAA